MDNIKTFFENIFGLLKLLFETTEDVKEAEDTYNEIVDNVIYQLINEYTEYIILGIIIVIIIIIILKIFRKK